MTFYADLHIHSKYSRATSRDCDLEHMAYWARRKGVGVLGTGDFTHPKWFEEIREKLVPAEPGLFRLRADLEREVDDWLARDHAGGGGFGDHVRFMLEVEISTIYKKDDRTRKVHHLIYAPDLEKAGRINERLARIGNIASDGRPILGLDSRDLLEITLEGGEGCYLIPAHIWTPWFAVLGSKSGFDTIDHCYGDLTSHIFALETGLSSDPAMNRRLSMLDGYTLVSNSDAHSPPKIGREASAFDTAMDYFAIREALKTGVGYGGTVEFFPDEGKYHLDGHRKCGVCLTPEESKRLGGLCPVCNKPLTLGVMHRVDALADRTDAQAPQVDTYRSFVPLDEVLSEIEGVGPKSKRVAQRYEQVISGLGSELFVLESAPFEDVKQVGGTLLAEALRRMRDGQVIRQGGFDGEYGVIRLFEKEELAKRDAVSMLFDMSSTLQTQDVAPSARAAAQKPEAESAQLREDNVDSPAPQQVGRSILDRLDPDQRAAASVVTGPLLIVAGPGTGKTRTLTHRLAHLVSDCGVGAQQCLAITFTRRAAGEMQERLSDLLPEQGREICVTTFHALGLTMLREHAPRLGMAKPPQIAERDTCVEQLAEQLAVSPRKAEQYLNQISRLKRDRTRPEAGSDLDRAHAAYAQLLAQASAVDFDDLVVLAVQLLEEHPDVMALYRARYKWVCIDEYQDIDPLQYRLIRLLVPENGNLCAIGDPDQAIYAFRGTDVRYFQQFKDDFPDAQTVALTRNYRSTSTIVQGALQLIRPSSLVPDRLLEAQIQTPRDPAHIAIHRSPTDRAEAEFVVHRIEQLIGGSTFFSLDSDRVASHAEDLGLSFSDFAVLYRTDAQADALVEALARSGMPFQKRSHDRLLEQPPVKALFAAAEQTDTAATVRERIDQAAQQVRDDHPQIEGYLPLLRRLAKTHDADWDTFVSQLTLGVDIDLWDPRADRISLLTLHAAKGLEFPVVFIVGCENGLIPLTWGQADAEQLEEERRLFFVGLTRAQKQLILTHADKRPWRGQVREMTRSPFLEDIERKLLAEHRHQHKKKKAAPKDEQLAFFSD